MWLMFTFIAYQIAWCVALPFFIIVILYRHFILHKPCVFKERCGWIPRSSNAKKVIWLHAVSVGEILSLEHVIQQMRKLHPTACCYVTTGTQGGKKMAQTHLDADYVSYIPFDFLICIWIAFIRTQPHALILIEAELWPNLLMVARLRSVPVYSLNARISDRSAPRYRRYSFLLRPLLACITRFYVQSTDDKKKFIALGVSQNAIDVLGNIKICNVLQKRQKLTLSESGHPNYTVLLVGSVHPGETQLYLNLFRQLKESHQKLKLLLVPRHFTWNEQLITMLETTNLRSSLWMQNDTNTQAHLHAALAHNDIIAIAKLGLLFELYAYADLFFLGGTFVPVGGHNLMEPAVWELPIIVGPYHHNCTYEVSELKKIHGIEIAMTEDVLYTTTHKLLTETSYGRKVGQNAHQWLVENSTTIDAGLTNLLKKL